MFWFQPILQAPSRTTRQSLIAAAYFASELALATALITGIYAAGRSLFPTVRGAGSTWAIVSAILVLYPGITQSLSAALLRIAANLLGSVCGFLVGFWFGVNTWTLMAALTATIFAGELLRMDLALRTACVAAVIVMTANDHQVYTSVVERLSAVAVGCAAALIVQVAARPVRKFIPFVVKVEVKAPQSGAVGSDGAE